MPSRRHPDVLVSDIGLPSEDGYTLIRVSARSKSPTRRYPRWRFTAYAQSRTGAGPSRGVPAYLAKPVEPEELLAALRRLGSSSAASRPYAS